MKNKTIWSVIIIVLIIIVVILGANNSKKSANNIKIGATLALSGNLSYVGESEKNGLLMAIEDINNAGGIKGRMLELKTEDNQGLANSAVSGVNKLINVDKTDIIFSSFTHITQAVKDSVATAQKPMIYAAALAEIAESNDLFFRDYFDTKDIGKKIADQIIRDKHNKVVYFGQKNTSCDDYLKTTKEILTKNGRVVVSEYMFAPEDNDLKTTLTKIKDTNPDAIFTCSHTKSDILMRQMDQLGMLNIPSYQLMSPFLPNGDTSEIRSLYEKNKTVTSWYGFVYGSPTDKQKEFRDRYEKKFGVKLAADVTFAYDDVMAMSTVIEKCLDSNGKIDNLCFSENFKKINYDGVSGKLTFNEKGVSQRDTLLMQVKDGEWVEVK
jgi:branched-chain amino acid transport system substrate-binding protein